MKKFWLVRLPSFLTEGRFVDGRVGVVEVSAGPRRENSTLPLSFLNVANLHFSAWKRVRKPALPRKASDQKDLFVGAAIVATSRVYVRVLVWSLRDYRSKYPLDKVV